MRKVLHVGPCNTPGGMAKVIEILSENPPEGWVAETWQSHIDSNPIAKYFHHRKMVKKLTKLLTNKDRPDIIHIHTAADWSWKRKARYVELCNQLSIPCIVHIHSGKFSDWLGDSNSKNSKNFRDLTSSELCKVVVLNDGWKGELGSKIGNCFVVNNPVDPKLIFENKTSNPRQVLLLGRYGKVKGHDFAIKLLKKLRREYDSSIVMKMTGTRKYDVDGLECYEWVTEKDKLSLIQNSSMLIIPSEYEGQPLVMLEALFCGTPCIVSDQIIDLPKSVTSAKYDDLNDWFKNAVELFDNPPDRAEINSSVQQFSIDSIKQNWQEIYDSLTN